MGSGNYTFRGLCGNRFALYLSDSYGNAEIAVDSEPIIWSNTATGYSHFNTYGDSIVSQEIYLEG